MSTMETIDGKLDKVVEVLGDVRVTLAKQDQTMADYVRRIDDLEVRMVPVEDHVSMAQGVAKFLGLLATLAGLVTAFWKGK